MNVSIKPNYYRVGSTGEHQLYPVVPEEDRNLPFTFDNLNPQQVKQEHMEHESELGLDPIEEWEENPWLQRL